MGSAECAGAEFGEITESDQDKGSAFPALRHTHQQCAVDHKKDDEQCEGGGPRSRDPAAGGIEDGRAGEKGNPRARRLSMGLVRRHRLPGVDEVAIDSDPSKGRGDLRDFGDQGSGKGASPIDLHKLTLCTADRGPDGQRTINAVKHLRILRASRWLLRRAGLVNLDFEGNFPFRLIHGSNRNCPCIRMSLFGIGLLHVFQASAN
jgi:hypothetical protein